MQYLINNTKNCYNYKKDKAKSKWSKKVTKMQINYCNYKIMMKMSNKNSKEIQTIWNYNMEYNKIQNRSHKIKMIKIYLPHSKMHRKWNCKLIFKY